MNELVELRPRTGASAEAPASPVALDHVELSIGGMTCPHCAQTVEKTVKAVPGVIKSHVNLANAVASIDYDATRAKVSDLLASIRSAGYAAGTAKIRIPIKYMHCASCVTRIEGALKATPGVVAASASLGTNAVDVEYQPEQTSFAALRGAIEAAGHKVAEPKPATAPEAEELAPEEVAQREEYRTLMRKFWVAAVIAVPVMGLSYPDLVPGLRDWMPAGSETRRIVWALLGAASLPVLLWSGSQFFTGMWDAVKHRSANMHTLIAIGISAAFLYSIVAVAWPELFPKMSLAEVFWDVTDVVVALVTLGLALELKAKGRTSEAIKKLIGLRPRRPACFATAERSTCRSKKLSSAIPSSSGRAKRLPSTARSSRGRAPSTSRC